MLIDQVFLYFLIAVGMTVSLPALWLLMRTRWPQRAEKLRVVSGRNLALSFLLGLPVLFVIIRLGMAAAQLGKRGDLPMVIGVALVMLLLALASLGGLVGLATLIGERLSSAKSPPDSWKATLRGGIVLVCLVAMPYVGWFALLPIGIITGAGMMVRSFFVRASQTQYAAVPEVAAPLPPALPPEAPPQTV